VGSSVFVPILLYTTSAQKAGAQVTVESLFFFDAAF
jgi:hypothetical protein